MLNFYYGEQALDTGPELELLDYAPGTKSTCAAFTSVFYSLPGRVIAVKGTFKRHESIAATLAALGLVLVVLGCNRTSPISATTSSANATSSSASASLAAASMCPRNPRGINDMNDQVARELARSASQGIPLSLDDRLARSAFLGDTRAVAQLLQKGVDIESYSVIGHFAAATALQWAASAGQIDVVKLLLEKGAKIEQDGGP